MYLLTIRWNKIAVLCSILILGLLILLIAYRETLLIAVSKSLITESKLEKADAILVLDGGEAERILEAVDLYDSGYASQIVLTRAEKPENQDILKSLGVTDLEGYEMSLKIAEKLGVPLTAITVLRPRVNSTFSEIELLTNYCSLQGYRSVILVTSKSHTTRSTKIFRHLSGGKTKVITRPSRYDRFDPNSWWKERRTIKEVLYEYQKLLNFYVIESW